ncbi:MAG TPA: M20/M25/M40 family metallo-hydrolase [Thermoanaerobaculia bacterium]|nr:M20/M25/M40 family metallo-hydrolase [Thermoanaerobaculia bacterium]
MMLPMMKRLAIAALLLTSCTTVTRAPVAPLTELPRVQQLAARADVRAAFDHVEQNREAILAEWIALTGINAPSGHEAERAAYVEALLRAMPLHEVRRDAAGNVIALRKGSSDGPTVVVDAHLDTVFSPGLEITPRIEEGRIHAPGAGDNTRNVAAILAVARALDAAAIRTRGDLIFLFTVEEETSFKGIDQFLADHREDIDHFIALDGGYSGFTYAGLGINWYRFHFIGPGGHTRSRTPPHSASLPLARAIARIYRLRVPGDSHLNVGMLGGAEVVNAKAADAWFSLDVRSVRHPVMLDLERRAMAIAEEEARRAGMTFRREVISLRAPAMLPGHREGPLVRTAEAVYEVLGFTNPSISPSATNHVNAVLATGISGISTGTTPCRDAHALTEWCEIEPIYRGIRKIILLALAMTGVE